MFIDALFQRFLNDEQSAALRHTLMISRRLTRVFCALRFALRMRVTSLLCLYVIWLREHTAHVHAV